ncbi:hypothetical protein STEG23_000328, partial [Scotinomys teguina]
MSRALKSPELDMLSLFGSWILDAGSRLSRVIQRKSLDCTSSLLDTVTYPYTFTSCHVKKCKLPRDINLALEMYRSTASRV